MSNLFEFLESKNDNESARSEVNGSANTKVLEERGIRFEDVGFQYPGRDDWALRHIDVFIPAGQSLALVGQNGAGKTTFIKLLTRLYVPTEGRVLLDGKDLKDWDESELRRRVGVLFQDFAKYHSPPEKMSAWAAFRISPTKRRFAVPSAAAAQTRSWLD